MNELWCENLFDKDSENCAFEFLSLKEFELNWKCLTRQIDWIRNHFRSTAFWAHVQYKKHSRMIWFSKTRGDKRHMLIELLTRKCCHGWAVAKKKRLLTFKTSTASCPTTIKRQTFFYCSLKPEHKHQLQTFLITFFIHVLISQIASPQFAGSASEFSLHPQKPFKEKSFLFIVCEEKSCHWKICSERERERIFLQLSFKSYVGDERNVRANVARY